MTEGKIIEVKRKYEDEWLQYDGVHAISIGYKISNGIQSDTLAIIVHTIDKKDMKNGQNIPKMIEGISTDVVESPPFHILPIVSEEENDTVEENKKYRPVPGGVEIYTPREPINSGICTLGMFAKSTKEGDSLEDIYLLTNAHCLMVPDYPVRQPFSNDPSDIIATSSRIVSSNQVDGGIAKMLSSKEVSYEILNIGIPQGTYDIQLQDIGNPVIKTGRTTGTTEGFIAYVDVTLIDIRNQIIIDAPIPFAAPGDSGSVVLLQEGAYRHYVVGLLWGGVLNYTIMSPIQPVMKELEIDVLTKQNI